MSFNHYCNTNIKTLQTLMVVGGVKPLSDLAFKGLGNIKIE